MTCIILSAYIIVTICILIWYTILLIHEIIMIKYHNAIVIVFLIGYHIFCTLLHGCYYETIPLDGHPHNHHI